jgi:ketosteroid isomerase-like protein
VLAYYPKVLAAFVEHEDVVERASVAGDVVTVEIRFDGRTHGGHEVAFDAVDVFDLRDGRIARISLWYDTADVLRQVRGEERS